MSVRVRILCFFAVLVLIGGPGLAYVYTRAPVFGGYASLTVEPPASLDAAQRALFPNQEAQALQSSDLSEIVRKKIGGVTGAGRITATAVPQTQNVELRVEAGNKDAIVGAMTAWIDAYIATRRVSDRDLDEGILHRAKQDVEGLKVLADAKRREADEFRRAHDIVSPEREENDAASRLKGAQAALNEAANREINAEARLKAINDNVAEGRTVVRAPDKQMIANLEMRAVELRERLRDLEHDFTPAYLATDPKAKSLKGNLTRVEQQIERERERSKQAALLEAQEDVDAARAAAARLRGQIESHKQETVRFAELFAQLKRLTLEADQADASLRAAAEQLSRLQVAQKASGGPRIQVPVPPTVREAPIRPDYAHDAGIVAATALGLAFLVVWLVDFLMRPPGRPTESAPQPIVQIAYPMLAAGHGSTQLAMAPSAPRLAGGTAALLSPATRELAQEEITRLWAAADDSARIAVAAISQGLTAEEIAAMRRSDADVAAGSLVIRGASARTVTLHSPLRGELGRGRREPGDENLPILSGAHGTPLSIADIEGMVKCVARDAGLVRPDEVDSAALRHTFVAFLARQGTRLGDITALAGWISPAVLAEYSRLSPPGQGIALDSIDPVMPALRRTH